MEIEKYLINKGINAGLIGFDYLTEAIELIRKDSAYKHLVTKRLYPEIAKTFKATPLSVDRSMKYALKQANIKTTLSDFIITAEIETR